MNYFKYILGVGGQNKAANFNIEVWQRGKSLSDRALELLEDGLSIH